VTLTFDPTTHRGTFLCQVSDASVFKIMCGKQTNKQTNGHKKPTTTTAVGVGNEFSALKRNENVQQTACNNDRHHKRLSALTATTSCLVVMSEPPSAAGQMDTGQRSVWPHATHCDPYENLIPPTHQKGPRKYSYTYTVPQKNRLNVHTFKTIFIFE